MRVALAMLALIASSQLPAQQQPHHEIQFSQASELMPWCQSQAQAHFAGMGIPTYQWTARFYEKGNTLFVEGKIRANGNDVPVTCQVAKGAMESYATTAFQGGH